MISKYPKRKSIRLPGFNYAQAEAYFVTVCSHEKKCIFGYIAESNVYLNKTGKTVAAAWKKLEELFPFVSLDTWVLMPNHLHGIIWINEENFDQVSLAAIISAFKALSTLEIRRCFGHNDVLWQQNFYEHIVRHDKDLFRIRQYIEDNRAQWEVDSENPDCLLEYDQRQ